MWHTWTSILPAYYGKQLKKNYIKKKLSVFFGVSVVCLFIIDIYIYILLLGFCLHSYIAAYLFVCYWCYAMFLNADAIKLYYKFTENEASFLFQSTISCGKFYMFFIKWIQPTTLIFCQHTV